MVKNGFLWVSFAFPSTAGQDVLAGDPGELCDVVGLDRSCGIVGSFVCFNHFAFGRIAAMA
jgi:hypothetical protein